MTKQIMIYILILMFSVLHDTVQGGQMVPGFGGTLQDWGEEETLDGSSMFWWLYFVDPPERPDDFNVYSRPLIVWLDGGPGDGGSGYGNFLQIGPLDIDGVSPRSTTWVKDHNVLFIDAPAGSGFSHVPDDSRFSSEDMEAALDIRACLMGVFDEHEEFRDVPMYIFGHSYGGKLAVLVAELLLEENESSQANLKGVGLSSPFVSPIDSALSWGTYHHNMGYLDAAQKAVIDDMAESLVKEAEKKDWMNAFTQDGATLLQLVGYTSFWNLEDVSKKLSPRTLSSRNQTRVEELMNNEVKEVLGISTTFGEQGMNVYNGLNRTFDQNVVSTVKKLVEESTLKIVVFGGQMDGIIPLVSTDMWVNRVFDGDEGWSGAPRTELLRNGLLEGYEKHYGDFSMYWILGAGHLVARDNPEAVRMILERLTGP